ncbi:uncharacterized protein N0V89_012640 [Didymosphaeria variabile]|uniref:Prion-inhibition and propagation HeLo domain-containing protein n=1 Tax=Didymosphaeria variabile TaxID=1932322 RepID=A0A9W9C6B0_9PLEO|nr:uncharacterized protein N0V89_012640 [Didymosphaeria variabile]KAJ4344895.1 hypothetical protein N0V89_012640 [Didymosphaeria variabile]
MKAETNHVEASGLSTPPPTPPASATLSKAQALSNVYSLATAFATCVEAFNLIHPHKDSDQAQKVALTKLGIQQGRLLIFGDAVGICAPPATIARHMVPSRPGLTNPDPTLPVNFGIRDTRLDDEDVRNKVTRALEEIYGRPAHLSRDQLMERYGLKQPKRFSAIEHPSLDTNRLEAFREKYALLNDLMQQSGIRPQNANRKGSMAMNHWTIKDVVRFDAFVNTVRIEVDGLIALMGVKEQVDRGMRTDIKAMAWHPDLQSMIVRQDWEKLRLIREAVTGDYPEYVEVADKALQYLVEELRGTKIQMLKMAQMGQASVGIRQVSDEKGGAKASVQPPKAGAQKEKRPGFWSRISGYKSSKTKQRSQSIVSAPEETDPQRSLSDSGAPRTSEDANTLTTVRSKSLSAVPDDQTPFDLNARLADLSVQIEQEGHNEDVQAPTSETTFHDVPGAEKTHVNVQATLTQIPTRSTADIDDVDPLNTTNSNGYNLYHADTANSLIDRHDMFRGVGRMDTRDIRDKSHDAAGW